MSVYIRCVLKPSRCLVLLFSFHKQLKKSIVVVGVGTDPNNNNKSKDTSAQATMLVFAQQVQSNILGEYLLPQEPSRLPVDAVVVSIEGMFCCHAHHVLTLPCCVHMHCVYNKCVYSVQ